MQAIENFSGYYVNKSGEIFSDKNGKLLKLKQSVGNRGYKQISIYDNNRKHKRLLVHRIVAKAFLPNINNMPVVNHIDNNTENNHVSNLEWTTQSGNILHAVRQGRFTQLENNTRLSAIHKKFTAMVKLNMICGTQVGSSKLISITQYGKHPKGILRCLRCASDRDTDIGRFILGNACACRSCNTKMMHRKRKMKI